MNGSNIFVDTNILLYLISGDETITNLLDGKSIFISFITELELLSFKELSEEEENKIIDLLSNISIIDINPEIKRIVIKLKKNYKIKLPDLIIASTAYFLNQPFITADKQLNQISELNILNYQK
ncbi:MAG: type II toxin-antitoxin system VapC family toxin [Pelobium sp.]